MWIDFGLWAFVCVWVVFAWELKYILILFNLEVRQG